MPRPIILGVVGDSASGKTTLTRGLVRLLGQEQVSHVCLDDYHRYDRSQRAGMSITPLHPECNHMDIMAQHLRLLRSGDPIMKPIYRHADGTFGPPVYLSPERFLIVEGLLGYHTESTRDCFDIRVYLDPPESLRRRWKVVRDCSRRGYTTNQVLDELDRREPDSEAFIRPQRHHADIVVRFAPPPGADEEADPTHLDAHLLLRPGLPHPDLSDVVGCDDDGLSLVGANGEQDLRVPGRLEPASALELEERIWSHMHFASHLRSERLGEFTIGTDLHRSDSLALVQLLVLYHLVTARAKVALGGAEAATRE
ncbi:MAG: phosphoribulokinase [Gaiellales bacterium]|jgi:phosphoribulokinase|nr:phosphoribulokinase [Gaiellales bacterium]